MTGRRSSAPPDAIQPQSAAYYFDTSALVKRYVREGGTPRILALTDSGAPIYIARITAVEMVSALRRKGRTVPKLKSKADEAIQQFRGEYEANHFVIVEIDAVVVGSAMALAEARGLRGYDAVQLASALRVHRARTMMEAPAITLVCADGELSAAALSEGLMVEMLANPS